MPSIPCWMLNVITFNGTAGRDEPPGLVGVLFPLHAAAMAAHRPTPTAEIRTSTSGANALPQHKADEAGRLQHTVECISWMSSSTRPF